MRRSRTALLSSALLFGAVLTVMTQEPPALGGRVVDASAFPLPGVSVTALAAATGQAWQTTTDAAGAYRFDSLPPGTYRIDFNLQAFDRFRLNHVRVAAGGGPVDATLHIGSICECIAFSWPGLKEREGRIVDERGRPIAFARIEVVAPERTESASTDHDGSFSVRLPVDDRWRMTASAAGYDAATQRVRASSDPILFRLRRNGTDVKTESERIARGCRCGSDLFTHAAR